MRQGIPHRTWDGRWQLQEQGGTRKALLVASVGTIPTEGTQCSENSTPFKMKSCTYSAKWQAYVHVHVHNYHNQSWRQGSARQLQPRTAHLFQREKSRLRQDSNLQHSAY